MKKHTPLGQHFLNNPRTVTGMVAAAELSVGTTVLEIGPGTGVLTREILKTAHDVIAIEKDPELAEWLRETFSKEVDSGVLTIIEDDGRTINPEKWGINGKYTVVANLPYYITGRFLRSCLSHPHAPERAVLLIQKEVADRILKKDGKGSLLSLGVGVYGTPKLVSYVKPGSFTPPPEVDSAVILIDDISKEFFTDVDEEFFFTVVRAGFAHKRKTLLSNLGSMFGKTKVRKVLETSGVDETARAETLSKEEWKVLARLLS